MFGGFTEGAAALRELRDPAELPAPQQDARHGPGRVSWSVRDESLHCEGIIRLFHTFAQETGALTQAVQDDIVDARATVVRLEDRFIDLAFEMGPVEGLDAAEIKAYIRYIADWRLKQLGLPQIYGVKEHPLPWLTAMLNGVEHANFFETRATEYAKAATGGAWHGRRARGACSTRGSRARSSPSCCNEIAPHRQTGAGPRLRTGCCGGCPVAQKPPWYSSALAVWLIVHPSYPPRWP